MDINGNGDNSIWAFLLFALFANGGYGGINKHGDYDYNRTDHQYSQVMDETRTNASQLQNQIADQSSELYQRTIFDKICETNRNIDESKYDNALILKDMALENFKCCCETDKAIWQSNKDLNDKIDFNTIQSLRDQGMRDYIDKKMLQSELDRMNRTCPTPAWVTCNPMAMGGCSTGCY